MLDIDFALKQVVPVSYYTKMFFKIMRVIECAYACIVT
jgi:hypothetical protein